MDSYFRCDTRKCEGCGACTEVCSDLTMSYGSPSYWNDYVSCHHCFRKTDEDGNPIDPPCRIVCPHDAISYERW